ncbi:WD repeat-containing protein 36 [Pyxicephalus adspersus]|uniref:WD repeat-containing protein 36 n=1 Tax=Pyxicephalus adspersus TaxID=30357 RepID=UPI003B5A07D1
MAAEKKGRGSVLFTGYRSLGLYSNHIPHVVRYHKRHKEFYVVTAVGKSFLTYNVNKLGQVAVSNAVPDDISCLAADRMLVFVAHGNLLKAFAKNKEVVHTYRGHEAEIHLVLPFGDHVISVDTNNTIIIWDVESEEEYLQFNFEKRNFAVSAIMHPSTYLNKILLGSQQGTLQLWNVKSNKLLYTLKGWEAGVTVLQQAPAVDVVAVGLTSGKIIVHNIKFDETLMTFHQDWGPITALSFRTDGHPIMAAGSPIGHIGLWDLEEKKLMSQMRDAHSTAIAGLTFVHGEPLLITNAADNALRVWIFDGPGGQGRLLRFRMGHSAPSTFIRHHGLDGKQILSAGQDGTLHSFSTVHDRFSKSLGYGSVNKAKSKKMGLRGASLRLPPVMSFASETARQSDWDSIIACHQNLLRCTTWNYVRSTMGAHKLTPPDFKKNRPHHVYATTVDLTSCGNFVVIGLSNGNVDVYNIQSGIHRGHYGKDTAHDGAVRGVAVDGLNQMTITAGSDQMIKFWKFKSRELIQTMNLSISPTAILLHRESICGVKGSLLHVSAKSGEYIYIYIIIVCFFFFYSLIDCFLLDSAVVSLTMSPTGDFLATAHVDDLGIYLWSNKSLFSLISLRPLPSDYEPVVVMLPGANEETEGKFKIYNTSYIIVNGTSVSHNFQIHLRYISTEPTLLEEISTLSSHLDETWQHIQTLCNQSLCVLNYMKSALL